MEKRKKIFSDFLEAIIKINNLIAIKKLVIFIEKVLNYYFSNHPVNPVMLFSLLLVPFHIDFYAGTVILYGWALHANGMQHN